MTTNLQIVPIATLLNS